ncbi:prefoldin subunit 4-like [Daphnia pulex]|uniref:prefoldin subunit 4-like n=1 Tax=Daphnia pulex TaxID=6669 RepID=UPI001EDFAB4F|nr:prefoldin subunit 4-like [Daphnia pulex]
MASVAVSKDSLESDSDIHITLEDQQKINRFARHNAKWEELRDDLKNKKGDLQNLEDASDDLLLVDDESAPIPFVVGEVFVHFNMEEAKVIFFFPLLSIEKLEEAKDKVKKDIEAIEAECTNIKTLMSDLKTQLYAKFGNSINLEAEEE